MLLDLNCKSKAIIVGVTMLAAIAIALGIMQAFNQSVEVQGPRTNGRIIFASASQNGNLQLYSINADGSDLRAITDDAHWNFAPLISPDRSLIAFMRSAHPPSESDVDLYVMLTDGKDMARLTQEGTFYQGRYSWSPDNRRIAYEASIGGNSHIVVVNVDGTNRTIITDDRNNHSRPIWTSNTTVVYESTSVTNSTLVGYLEQRDVSTAVRQKIIDFQKDAGNYILSPNSKSAAFFAYQRNAQDDGFLYSLNSIDLRDGRTVKLADGFTYMDPDFSWAPDSSAIAFLGARTGDNVGQIYVVNLNDLEIRKLSYDVQNESKPAWSEDGRLAFIKAHGEYFPWIVLAEAEGSMVQKIAQIRYPIIGKPLDWLSV